METDARREQEKEIEKQGSNEMLNDFLPISNTFENKNSGGINFSSKNYFSIIYRNNYCRSRCLQIQGENLDDSYLLISALCRE